MIGVALVAGSGHWDGHLLRLTGGQSPDISIVRRCADLVEARALVAAGLVTAVAVDGSVALRDADQVTRLVVDGAWVVVVGAAHPRASVVLPEASPAFDILTALAQAPGGAGHPFNVESTPGPLHLDLGPGHRPTVGAGPWNMPSTDGPWSQGPGQHGRIVTVWGGPGSPGRTTTALGLGACLAERGLRTLVVDLDTYGGALAPVLGLVDDGQGIVAACSVARAGRLRPADVLSLSRQVTPGLAVLTGITRAERWPEVLADAIPTVLERAAAIVDFVIVDSGFCVEDGSDFTFAGSVTSRNDAHRAALIAADELVVVGGCEPLALARLIGALAELDALDTTGRRHIAVTRVPGRRSARRASELAAAVRVHAQAEPDVLVPVISDASAQLATLGRGGSRSAPTSLIRAYGPLADALGVRGRRRSRHRAA